MGHGIASDNRAAERPLGIVTKNPATPLWNPDFDAISGEGIDWETGELLARSPQAGRAERWALKSVVNRLLPGERVSKCMVLRAPVPGQGLASIEVHKGRTHGKAFYHGLMACGSVWTCPICAAKIAERRRVELQQALDAAKAKGWGIHFVTLTVPHGIGDDLHEILSSLSEALGKMSRNAPFRRAKAQTGLQIYGYIRAQEVTYGQNGWHPHYHLLVFTQGDMHSSVVRYCYDKAWRSACVASGLPEPHQVHGCTVQDGREAAKYVSKWGLEDEMTKAHTKKAKRHGLTPWGLLAAVLDGNAPEIAPEAAAALFRLYAHAFKGRRQLHWSVGLRAKLLPGNVELTDEQLAERPEDERADLLAELSTDDWKAVRVAKMQAALLDAAEADPRCVHVVLEQAKRIAVRCATGMPAGAHGRALTAISDPDLLPIVEPLLPAFDPLLADRPGGWFSLADIFGKKGARRSGAEERPSDERASS